MIGRSAVLDEAIIPVITASKALCGWRVTPIAGARDPIDTIILGPKLKRARLNIHRSLVDQWCQNATRKGSLWSSGELRELPKLLVVLEEWICPTWTHISWDEYEDDSPFGASVIGLVATGEADASTWEYLSMPGETLTMSHKIGNTSVGRPSILY